MQPWLVRGCAMAVVYAAAETLLAEFQIGHPSGGSILDPVVLALLVGVGGLWGGLDGWLRKPRRGMNWFYGALIAGVLAGLLTVVAKAVFVDQTGLWALGPALTGDAAFIALLVMLPAGLGIAVGGRLPAPEGRSDQDADTGPSRFPGRGPLRSVSRG
jgi:hypothetical protein